MYLIDESIKGKISFSDEVIVSYVRKCLEDVTDLECIDVRVAKPINEKLHIAVILKKDETVTNCIALKKQIHKDLGKLIKQILNIGFCFVSLVIE